MLVEEEQIELKDCERTFVEERELDPEKVKRSKARSKPEMGGRRERRWIDKEQAGCQRFQRFGSAPGQLLRSCKEYISRYRKSLQKRLRK